MPQLGDLMRLAKQAMLDKKPDIALEHWTEMRSLAPHSKVALQGLARALMKLSRTDALIELAESVKEMPDVERNVLAIAFARPATNVTLSIAWCRAAEMDGDDAEAIQRWTRLRKFIVSDPVPHRGLIDALLRSGRIDEADRVAAAAAKFFRRDADFAAQSASIAERRADWPQAASRWAHVAKQFKNYPDAKARLESAQRNAAATGAASAPHEATNPPSEEDREAAAGILARLENIGRNCELGLLQRHFGIEPISLLRFSTTRPAALITLLKTRFFGIGEVEHNEIILKKREYRLRHKPTGLTSHTRVMVGDAEPDKLLVSQCRHTRYLRDKLIEDLEQQTKIFVYQNSDLNDATIHDIADGLAAYGPNIFLCVRLCSPEKPPGTIEYWGDTVLVCHIDREGQEFKGSGWNISIDLWLAFARAACARADALSANTNSRPADNPA